MSAPASGFKVAGIIGTRWGWWWDCCCGFVAMRGPYDGWRRYVNGGMRHTWHKVGG